MKELQEALVSIETAKLARKAGFNIKCRKYYNPKTDKVGNSRFNVRNKHAAISAPTQSKLVFWLRKKYNYNVWVEKHPDDERYFPQCPECELENGIGIFFTYECAMEAMLVVALNKINKIVTKIIL